MNTLHTINKAGQPLELCLRTASNGDTILLIEDGAYIMLNMPEPLTDHSVFVLEQDAIARGVTIPESVTSVDYDQFVKLTCDYPKTLSWF